MKGKFNFVILLTLGLLSATTASSNGTATGMLVWDGFTQGDSIQWTIDTMEYNSSLLDYCSMVNITCDYFHANPGDVIEYSFTSDLNYSLDLSNYQYTDEEIPKSTAQLTVAGVVQNQTEVTSFPFFIDTEIERRNATDQSGAIGGGGLGMWLIVPDYVGSNLTGLAGDTIFGYYYGTGDLSMLNFYETDSAYGINLDNATLGFLWHMEFQKATGIANYLEWQDSQLHFVVSLKSANLALFPAGSTGSNTSSTGLPLSIFVALTPLLIQAVIYKKRK